MTLTLTSRNTQYIDSQNSAEFYAGETHGKTFEVIIDPMAAPRWSGEELDFDEREEVLTEIDSLSNY